MKVVNITEVVIKLQFKLPPAAKRIAVSFLNALPLMMPLGYTPLVKV